MDDQQLDEPPSKTTPDTTSLRNLNLLYLDAVEGLGETLERLILDGWHPDDRKRFMKQVYDRKLSKLRWRVNLDGPTPEDTVCWSQGMEKSERLEWCPGVDENKKVELRLPILGCMKQKIRDLGIFLLGMGQDFKQDLSEAEVDFIMVEPPREEDFHWTELGYSAQVCPISRRPPTQEDFQRWCALFGPYDFTNGSIVIWNFRRNPDRRRIRDEKWDMIKWPAIADGYNRESYEYAERFILRDTPMPMNYRVLYGERDPVQSLRRQLEQRQSSR